MNPPQYQPPVDPNLQAETDAANKAKAEALQLRLKGDTADVMARYGARVAMAGGGVTSVTSTPALTPLTRGIAV